MTEYELRKLFAKRISRKLVANNMKQIDLAEKTGIPKQTISRYMNCQRKPTYDTVILIAQALNCTPGDLIDIDEQLERGV